MRFCVGAAMLAAAMAVALPVSAQDPALLERIDACDRPIGETTLEAKAAACTAVIDHSAIPAPVRALAYAKRGMLVSHLGQNVLAAADSDKAIALDAANPMLWLMRGFIFGAKGDFAEARTAFDKGIVARPNDPHVLSKRGAALIELGKPAEALADAEAALAVDPANFQARIVKAQALARLGDHAQAERLFDDLVAQSPEPYVYVRRAYAHIIGGRYARALADYDALLKSDPENASLHYARGEAYRGMGELAKAFADYDKALLIDPDSAYLRNGRCWARAAAGIDLAKAMDDCNASIALDPEDANNYDSRGMVRLKMGDAAGAFADYDKAMTYGVEKASYLYGRGIAAIRLGHMVAGEADLARAAALDPGIAARYAKDGIQP